MSHRLSTLVKMRRERGTLATVAFIASRIRHAARTGKLSPPNTIPANLALWSRYDWSAKGEEWSNSPEFKLGIIRKILIPNVPSGSRILEIGPGAGRWTEVLLKRAEHLTLVDLTPECIRICRERFAKAENISYFVNDGKDLSFVPPASIDRIWSLDVFVHIQSSDVDDYVRQFVTILAPGGRAIIHHSARGVSTRLWRSDMTVACMSGFCAKYGLKVIEQRSEWGDFKINDDNRDVVSIFERPA
jgi:SAM-dependent methyltransferase